MQTLVAMTPLATMGGPHAAWGGGGIGLFGPLFFLLLLGAVAAIAWFAAKGELPWRRSPVDEARRILLERYARGEISDEEFRQRAELLR